MSLIYIPESCFTSPTRVLPSELNGIIDPGQWAFICSQMHNVNSEATMTACLVELFACFLCAFPCIFCCHPCISRQFEINKRQESIHVINLHLFNGSPVLATTGDGNLMINTTFMNAVAATPIPQYAQAQYTSTTINPAVLYTPPQINQTMAITIPDNCVAGSILTVLTPQGNQISVTVPDGVKPGSIITVSY